jgi:hypothetical protein
MIEPWKVSSSAGLVVVTEEVSDRYHFVLGRKVDASNTCGPHKGPKDEASFIAN